MWQSIYEELKSDNFEIISVAQDTGGEAAAGSIFDDANVSYTSIIDVNHHISALYNLVNVPSGIWIDEEGKIVRLNEGTYAKTHFNGQFGTDDYVPIVRDWVAKGAESEYVWDREKVRSSIFQRTPDAERAQPAFRLGTYYFTADNDTKAEQYWTMAQELDPTSWNYLRQDLQYEEGGSAGPQWQARREQIESAGGVYYAPLEIDAVDADN
ncbi:MAG: hypothetical protein COA96_11650 [SAR86 cluster bacterium]|uniref:TlpA family protein disulfide reductase n=1 Tax=SAR86 cluster bacterium TaxID=2030880 RepID=A0A2A5AXH6_9GAMM|nr:MAG: hypothetical protein COA96_11650 [SAR86 cluster bacterium]